MKQKVKGQSCDPDGPTVSEFINSIKPHHPPDPQDKHMKQQTLLAPDSPPLIGKDNLDQQLMDPAEMVNIDDQKHQNMNLINQAITNMYVDQDQINQSRNDSASYSQPTNSHQQYETFGPLGGSKGGDRKSASQPDQDCKYLAQSQLKAHIGESNDDQNLSNKQSSKSRVTVSKCKKVENLKTARINSRKTPLRQNMNVLMQHQQYYYQNQLGTKQQKPNNIQKYNPNHQEEPLIEHETTVRSTSVSREDSKENAIRCKPEKYAKPLRNVTIVGIQHQGHGYQEDTAGEGRDIKTLQTRTPRNKQSSPVKNINDKSEQQVKQFEKIEFVLKAKDQKQTKSQFCTPVKLAKFDNTYNPQQDAQGVPSSFDKDDKQQMNRSQAEQKKKLQTSLRPYLQKQYIKFNQIGAYGASQANQGNRAQTIEPIQITKVTTSRNNQLKPAFINQQVLAKTQQNFYNQGENGEYQNTTPRSPKSPKYQVKEIRGSVLQSEQNRIDNINKEEKQKQKFCKNKFQTNMKKNGIKSNLKNEIEKQPEQNNYHCNQLNDAILTINELHDLQLNPKVTYNQKFSTRKEDQNIANQNETKNMKNETPIYKTLVVQQVPLDLPYQEVQNNDQIIEEDMNANDDNQIPTRFKPQSIKYQTIERKSQEEKEISKEQEEMTHLDKYIKENQNYRKAIYLENKISGMNDDNAYQTPSEMYFHFEGENAKYRQVEFSQAKSSSSKGRIETTSNQIQAQRFITNHEDIYKKSNDQDLASKERVIKGILKNQNLDKFHTHQKHSTSRHFSNTQPNTNPDTQQLQRIRDYKLSIPRGSIHDQTCENPAIPKSKELKQEQRQQMGVYSAGPMGGSSEVMSRLNQNPFSAMAQVAPKNEYSGPNDKATYHAIYKEKPPVLPGNISRSKGHSTKISPRNIKIKVNHEQANSPFMLSDQSNIKSNREQLQQLQNPNNEHKESNREVIIGETGDTALKERVLPQLPKPATEQFSYKRQNEQRKILTKNSEKYRSFGSDQRHDDLRMLEKQNRDIQNNIKTLVEQKRDIENQMNTLIQQKQQLNKQQRQTKQKQSNDTVGVVKLEDEYLEDSVPKDMLNGIKLGKNQAEYVPPNSYARQRHNNTYVADSSVVKLKNQQRNHNNISKNTIRLEPMDHQTPSLPKYQHDSRKLVARMNSADVADQFEINQNLADSPLVCDSTISQKEKSPLKTEDTECQDEMAANQAPKSLKMDEENNYKVCQQQGIIKQGNYQRMHSKTNNPSQGESAVLSEKQSTHEILAPSNDLNREKSLGGGHPLAAKTLPQNPLMIPERRQAATTVIPLSSVIPPNASARRHQFIQKFIPSSRQRKNESVKPSWRPEKLDLQRAVNNDEDLVLEEFQHTRSKNLSRLVSKTERGGNKKVNVINENTKTAQQKTLKAKVSERDTQIRNFYTSEDYGIKINRNQIDPGATQQLPKNRKWFQQDDCTQRQNISVQSKQSEDSEQGSERQMKQNNQQYLPNPNSSTMQKLQSIRGKQIIHYHRGSITVSNSRKELEQKKKFSIDDFQVIRSLGQGSYGKVMLVRDSKSGKYFALKCLVKSSIRGNKQIQHILNEKGILQKFQPKDFCCNIHESMQDETHLYMVLEYLPGGELIKHIRKSVFMSEEDTRFYLAEIVLAVESLHQQGIIYRDLKPENILIDKDGHIKLIDFGFAKCMKDINKDRAYTNCGTPGYCAPEVMIPSAGHTYKADIWSIGILICEMIGGFTPFQNKHEASNPKAIMERCRVGKLNLPKNLHGNARDLVKLLLTDDPVSRLEIGQIKQHKFFRDINWNKIKERSIPPPFVPDIESSLDMSTMLDQQQIALRNEQDEISKNLISDTSPQNDLPELERIPEIPGEAPTCADDSAFKSDMATQIIKLLSQEANTYSSSKKSFTHSFQSSKKFSATGGTGGFNASMSTRNKIHPTKVLGDYQMVMVNKAFKDF